MLRQVAQIPCIDEGFTNLAGERGPALSVDNFADHQLS